MKTNKKNNIVWKKIGLPNPPNEGQYVLSSLNGKPAWLEVTPVE